MGRHPRTDEQRRLIGLIVIPGKCLGPVQGPRPGLTGLRAYGLTGPGSVTHGPTTGPRAYGPMGPRTGPRAYGPRSWPTGSSTNPTGRQYGPTDLRPGPGATGPRAHGTGLRAQGPGADMLHALSIATWHINMWTVKFTVSNVKSRVRRGNNHNQTACERAGGEWGVVN